MRNTNFYLIFIALMLLMALALLPATSIGAAKSAAKKGKSTQYVSDNVAITLRSGKSNQHRIIRTLDSGTKLRILETDKTHARVKTSDGTVGWVLKRYLVNEPVARTLLPPLQEKLAKLETKYSELRAKHKEIIKERNELAVIASKYEKLEAKFTKVSDEAARLSKIASETDQIYQENQSLTTNNASLAAQKNMLMNEIKELQNGNNKLWFLTGAGVIFIGILIGSLLTRSRKSKGSSWGGGADTLVLRQP
jgi:SH3 domain protein